MGVSTKHNEKLIEVVRNKSLPAADRSDILIFNLCEHGTDYKPAVLGLIQEIDAGSELKQKLESLGEGTLASERFLGTFRQSNGRMYAIVTRGPTDVFLPAVPEDVDGFGVGDPVMVDTKQERIVGRDGQVPVSGEIVPVETIPADRPGHVIVRHRDQLQLARLHHELSEHPDRCAPETQVIYDPVTRFVLGIVDTKSGGDELLVDPDRLERVTLGDVGGCKPVVFDILERIKQYVECTEWVKTMLVRPRCGYLFAGATGGGKSFHLKLLANLTHDLVEEYTGTRSSRLVMTDASQFWSPYFGETEQNISRWAERLACLGSRKLVDRNGREIVIPLIVVLEECESLLRARGEMQSSGHLFDRPLSIFLQKTESLESALEVPIIWVATSNRPDLADAAALRRIGMRKVTFGTLTAAEALAVLKTKLPPELPICSEGDRDDAREGFYRKTIGYLYGPDPMQELAEVHFSNSSRRTISRREMVTPALLEEAISGGIDRCLQRSRKAGKLIGLDATDVVAFLHRHFTSLAHTLRPHNVAEHCPEWFDRDPLHPVNVVTLVDGRRRPASLAGRLP